MIRSDIRRTGCARSGSTKGMGFNLFGMEVDLNPFHSPVTQAVMPVLQSIPIVGGVVSMANNMSNAADRGNAQAGVDAAMSQAADAINKANAQTAAANAAITKANTQPAAMPGTPAKPINWPLIGGVTLGGGLLLVMATRAAKGRSRSRRK